MTDLRLEIPGEPALLDRWHRHADGTWSKVLLNRMGESVGVLSINEGWARAALDLDGDGLVDFLHMATLDGREDVLASVGEGTEFLERWLLGENVLCDPGASRDHPDRPSLLGVEGTLESCRDSGSRERGPLAGIGGEKAPSHSDPGDRLCEGRGAKRGMMPAGVGPRTDDGAVAGFVGWIVGKAFDAAVQGVATVRYANAAGVFIAITWEPAMVGERTETSDSVVEFGTSGGENPPGGDDEDEVEDEEPDASSAGRARWTPGPDDLTDAEEALDRYCAMRAQSARRYWMVSLEQAEKQAAGAAETDCDDPVTDPAAMDDRAAMPKCGPARESGSVTEQVMAMLGAYNDRRCGPYEQPGPDGQCRGGRNLSDGRARLWYGYGDLIGLVPCEGTACDPRQNP